MTATGRHGRRLQVALTITLVVLVVELVGAALSGSLALLADAGHMLTDAAAIGLALLAATLAARPATPLRTFGYQRAEILAATLNAVLLLGVAGYVLVEAVRRWVDPVEVEAGPMLVFALVGLVANAASLVVLRGGQAESLNMRGAYLEVLGDLLGSVAVIVAAGVILVSGYTRADAVASVVIALLILPRTWLLLRDAVDVLLEATPRNVDLRDVREHIRRVDGVVDVHDLHAWTITSGMPVLSAHVVVSDEALAERGGGRILDELCACLGDHFDVAHCTFQLEPVTHRDHESPVHP